MSTGGLLFASATLTRPPLHRSTADTAIKHLTRSSEFLSAPASPSYEGSSAGSSGHRPVRRQALAEGRSSIGSFHESVRRRSSRSMTVGVQAAAGLSVDTAPQSVARLEALGKLSRFMEALEQTPAANTLDVFLHGSASGIQVGGRAGLDGVLSGGAELSRC